MEFSPCHGKIMDFCPNLGWVQCVSGVSAGPGWWILSCFSPSSSDYFCHLPTILTSVIFWLTCVIFWLCLLLSSSDYTNFWHLLTTYVIFWLTSVIFWLLFEMLRAGLIIPIGSSVPTLIRPQIGIWMMAMRSVRETLTAARDLWELWERERSQTQLQFWVRPAWGCVAAWPD